MNDARLVWALLVPLLSGGAAGLLIVAFGGERTPAPLRRLLPPLTLAISLGGLVAAMLLLLLAQGESALLGTILAISPVSRISLLAANTALISLLLLHWGSRREGAKGALSATTAICVLLSSSLLSFALLSDEQTLSVVCLMGVALAVGVLALSSLPKANDEKARTLVARRIAGGLKSLALALVGSGLLLVGLLLLSRYGLNLENRGLLQLGLGLLAVGLLVRSGATPFSAAAADLVEAAPSAAILMLGGAAPTVLVAGLLWLAPVGGGLAPSASGEWLGAIAALLAGLRALASAGEARRVQPKDSITGGPGYAPLVAATVALPIAWALFGVLSGSRSGAIGGALLAANLALAAPLLVAGCQSHSRLARVALLVGAGSLLGLPPLGGFVGTLLVAQAAANAGGVWLAVLLLGSLLTAAAWVSAAVNDREQVAVEGRVGGAFALLPYALVVVALICVQIVLFIASGPLITSLSEWSINIPWLSAP